MPTDQILNRGQRIAWLDVCYALCHIGSCDDYSD